MNKILTYGDSLTAGFWHHGFEFDPYSNQLELAGMGDVENVGMCGWTSEQMANLMTVPHLEDCCDRPGKGLQVLLSENHFNWVFIMAGTNDFADDRTAADIFADICRLVECCIQYEVENIGLLTVPPCGAEERCPEIRQARTGLNSYLRTASERFGSQVFVVDSASILPNDEDSRKKPEVAELWDRDLLHLSKKGSETLGQYVLQQMQERIRRTALGP